MGKNNRSKATRCDKELLPHNMKGKKSIFIETEFHNVLQLLLLPGTNPWRALAPPYGSLYLITFSYTYFPPEVEWWFHRFRRHVVRKQDHRSIFFRLEVIYWAWKSPDSEPTAQNPFRRNCAQDFYVLKDPPQPDLNSRNLSLDSSTLTRDHWSREISQF